VRSSPRAAAVFALAEIDCQISDEAHQTWFDLPHQTISAQTLKIAKFDFLE
jgi:hypothetical protein